MKNYKFSIITVTLNSEKFLERCLNSVKNLNHKNLCLTFRVNTLII